MIVYKKKNNNLGKNENNNIDYNKDICYYR